MTVHIDDGRAFVERDDGQYDLILFALPDSLTLFAGQGSLRLENYLFTKESMETVQRHLAAGRHLRDVQLLRAVPARPVRHHAAGRVRHGAVRRGRRLAGRSEARPCWSPVPAPRATARTPWAGARVDSPTDDYPFPYLAGAGRSRASTARRCC